jgi:hypothetical protein
MTYMNEFQYTVSIQVHNQKHLDWSTIQMFLYILQCNPYSSYH